MNYKLSFKLAANLGLSLTYAFLGLLLIYFCFKPFIKPAESIFSMVTGSGIASDITSIYVPKDHSSDAANASEKGVALSDIVMPKYGQQYGEIIIDSVGIKQALIMGDGEDILHRGVGQYFGSQLPGFGGKILLAGHNTKPYLKPLENIKVGDTIKINTSYGNYEYKIYETKVHSKTDKTAYSFKVNEETLILYTCYPFTLGYKKDRLFVYAHKTSGPDIIK
jgi:sortase A